MTAILDWITQHLTAAPLWIQSPLVIAASVLVCALLAVPLLRITDVLGAFLERISTSVKTSVTTASRKGN